jgi:hypothetical protein
MNTKKIEELSRACNELESFKDVLNKIGHQHLYLTIQNNSIVSYSLSESTTSLLKTELNAMILQVSETWQNELRKEISEGISVTFRGGA